MKNNPRNAWRMAFLVALLLLLPAACGRKSPDNSTPKAAIKKTSVTSDADNAASQENRDAQVAANDQKTPPDTPKDADTKPVASIDDIFLDIGLASHDLGRDDEACFAWEQALLFNPRNVVAMNNLGNLEFLYGNYAEAKKYYQQASCTNPDVDVSWYNLGNAVIALSQQQSDAASSKAAMSEAEQYYRYALYLNPDFALAQGNLARLLRAMNRPDEADAIDPQKTNAKKPSQ